jgi:hypothetical protein
MAEIIQLGDVQVTRVSYLAFVALMSTDLVTLPVHLKQLTPEVIEIARYYLQFGTPNSHNAEFFVQLAYMTAELMTEVDLPTAYDTYLRAEELRINNELDLLTESAKKLMMHVPGVRRPGPMGIMLRHYYLNRMSREEFRRKTVIKTLLHYALKRGGGIHTRVGSRARHFCEKLMREDAYLTLGKVTPIINKDMYLKFFAEKLSRIVDY